MLTARVRAEMQGEMSKLRAVAIRARVRDVTALQARLDVLHAAKLLADEELYAIEDIIAEEDEASEDDRVSSLIALSNKLVGDAALSRQLRRKFA